VTNSEADAGRHFTITKEFKKNKNMEDNNLQPEESLRLINGIINSAKNKLADDGFQFIFWGWLVIVCAMTHYISLKLNFEMGYMVWIILPPLGVIVSTIYGYKQGKKSNVKTYMDTYLGFLWGGFIIATIITLAFGFAHGIKATYFFLMILYGVATFITGGMLNFKPLIIGSLFSFALAGISVFLGNVDQFLCISAALLCSYVIPGHLLQSKFKQQAKNV
jgi:hypothetical protein